MMARMVEGRRQAGGTTTLTLVLIAFVAVGSVMVFYLWEAFNELLAGHIVPRHLLLGLVLLVVLALFLSAMSRYIQRAATAHAPDRSAAPPASHGSGG